MGFSLYNNVAIAASVARKRFNVPKVMIVDWVRADFALHTMHTHHHSHTTTAIISGHIPPG
jgi:hypothetical protein